MNIIKTLENGKAASSVKRLNEHLYTLEVDFDDNSNIGKEGLGKKWLHLNPRGSGKLAINFIKEMIDSDSFQDDHSIQSEIIKSVLSETSNFQNCDS